ncbi:MAG TPA: hypothetical protein DCF66_03500 [Lachnospiraceae bacterium]|nr:hypothetical protein [Lachnospiraceae bacterium]
MIDRYQVIYDMERCISHVQDACRDCSLYTPDDCNLDCMERLMQNAMELLKEQEQKLVCPKCNGQPKSVICGLCGQAVKLE